MSLQYRAEPNPNRADQVRLFTRCASDGQAEALWRALRARFPSVSVRMPSFVPGYTDFFFVQTSVADLLHAWPQIMAAVAPATAPVRPAQSPPRPSAQLGDLAAWNRTFRAAVRRVHEEIPRQSTATQDVSLGWVVEQVRAGNADAVESLLNGPLMRPASVLRAQIALYSETGQHERLVAIVESRRREVLALPTSGLLAEQIIGAYLSFAQASGVEDALRGAQQIARVLLPELERLHQADGVREMLRRALTPAAPPADPTSTTLREQIAGIVQVAPADQIEALEGLRGEHAAAPEVSLALGAAYAAVGQVDAALSAYAGVVPRDDEERAEVLGRQAELLVDAGRYREARDLLPDTIDMAPSLAALRGVALYWLGQLGEARGLLERAWAAGERRRAVLLPLARSRATAGQDDGALQVYRTLLDNAPELLDVEDLARLALGLYMDRPSDISANAIADLCDRYIVGGGPASRPTGEVADILRARAELWADADRERWYEAKADSLEWLASQALIDDLRAELDGLRRTPPALQLGRREQFELLEGLEDAALGSAEIRATLAGEYQSICTAAVDEALLRNEPIPAFVRAAQRSLHFLDRVAADFVAEYIDDERAQLARRSLAATPDVFAHEQTPSLVAVRLTIIGGHAAMRLEAERELRDTYGLTDYLEVPPSSEAHVDRGVVRDRVVGRDLVVVVTGYTGHDLTNHVRDLQRAGDLSGRVIWPKCRGKSGVVREILLAVQI